MATDDEEEDEDIELEVDSPVHSPAPKRRSPSPNDIRAPDSKNDEEHGEDGDLKPSRSKEQRFEEPISKDQTDAAEITHCHHNGGSQTHYTMRPPYDYYQSSKEFAASMDYSHIRQHHSILSKIPEPYLPMLHVRRDLHHKGSLPPATSTGTKSGVSLDHTPNFLGSMPFRKRTAAGFIRDHHHHEIAYSNHHLQQQQEKMNPLNLSSSGSHQQPPNIHHLVKSTTEHRHNIIKPSDTLPSQSSEEPPPALVVATAPSVLNHQATAQSQANGLSQQQLSRSTGGASSAQHQPPPPRRTGFSIEDIMRR